MYKLLGWTYGQINTFSMYKTLLKHLFTGKIPFKRIFSALLASVNLLNAACWKTTIKPRGEELDLTGYSLVFEDEFEGSELDMSAWFNRCEGERRTGFNAKSQATVCDGNLHLTCEYLKDGEFCPGWYTGMVCLRKQYKQGYFEIRCKCNEGDGFWSAFWLQATGDPYDHDKSDGGLEAVEIDIFESTSKRSRFFRSDLVNTTIHCNGFDDDRDSLDTQRVGDMRVKDIHKYNTYGLKWTEDEYIFYINGVESARSSFAKGVCKNPEQVIISLEMPEEIPEEILADKNYTTEMVIDYIRIYQ